MTATKTDKPLSIKELRRKAGAKVSAVAFLAEHAARLAADDIRLITSPIISAYEAKEIMASPALHEIKCALDNYIVELEYQKANDATDKARKKLEGGVSLGENPKNYLAIVYNAQGEILTYVDANGNEKLLASQFDLPQRASEWACRKLVDQATDSYAMVQWLKVPETSKLAFTRIDRDAATGKVFYKKANKPVTERKGSGSAGWEVKSKPSRAIFSAG